MCPTIRRPQSDPSRGVAATFRLRALSPLPAPSDFDRSLPTRLWYLAFGFWSFARVCRLFRRKYLNFPLFSANRSRAHRNSNLVAPRRVFRALSLKMLTFTPQLPVFTIFTTQVPAFTIFTPKIFSPRIQPHFFAFGLWSFSFDSIRVNSWFPLLPNARDFHASKTSHSALCDLNYACTKPTWYRGFLICTAKPYFFSPSTFVPFCPNKNAIDIPLVFGIWYFVILPMSAATIITKSFLPKILLLIVLAYLGI